MTCNFESEVEIKLDFNHTELFAEIVNTVMEEEKCPYDVTVDLLLTDDEAIREINKENRDIDASTDVLSFPMNVFPAPGDFSDIENDPDAFDPDSEELMLGDIVLSQDHILAQSKEYGHSVKREYAFLIVHSLLHLIGYDHIEDDDRKVMEQHQKDLMEVLNIPR